MEVIKKFFWQKEEIHKQDELSSLLADLLSEIDEAKLALNYAHKNLDYAEEYFVDAAAKEVEFSRSRLDALLRKYKDERARYEDLISSALITEVGNQRFN